jgi:hypothetical protein
MRKNIRGDKNMSEPPIQMNVVGGPKPYLWIGDANGYYLGSVSDARLRLLRDEITKALRKSR